MLTEREIQMRLARALNPEAEAESPYPADYFEQPPQQAAVLIPMIAKSDGWHLVLIRRSLQKQDRHSGQVAFPGGRCEASDRNTKQAALREAKEEINLQPGDAHVLGRLPSFRTITNYLVTPYVATMPWPYPLRPQPSEVARIFSIPLDWLADKRNHQVRHQAIRFQNSSVPVIFFADYDGEVLWGASARITMMLLEALKLA